MLQTQACRTESMRETKAAFFLVAEEGKGERAPSQPQLLPLKHLAEAHRHQAPGDEGEPSWQSPQQH